MKKWTTASAPAGGDTAIYGTFGELLGGILMRRGITTLDAAQKFFGGGGLSDPFLMNDMESAVEIIRDALDSGKKITIYGDYDCDGTTATAILYSYLQAMGAEVDCYIPESAEGYGMNIPALERIVNGGTELVITVDNGITAIDEAKFLKDKNVELVITDHHQPGAELPVCGACVDPNRLDDISPCKDLCGAGVALKLLIALEGDEEFVMDTFAHLAAVGTIGDVMPLKGENRYIVKRGIMNIRNEQNAGLTELLRSASRSVQNVTATDIAFCVCPRINAARRLDSPQKALRLLLCEDDAETARTIAEQLSELNNKRRSEENRMLSEIEQYIAQNPLVVKQRVIVLSGAGWHRGIIGIVCSRLLEKYDKPVVIISIDGDEAVGSMRSIEGFSAHRMLMFCERCLKKYGGHTGAGGFTLNTSRIAEFTECIHDYAKLYYPKMPDVALYADMETTLSALSLESVKRLPLLEPFGTSNPTPLFLIRECVVTSKRSLKDGKYTSFEVRQGNVSMRCISFKLPFAEFFAEVGEKIDLIASAEINEYNGNESVQLRIADYRPSCFREDKFFAAKRVYEEICRGEGCDPRLAPRVIPQNRGQLMTAYDVIRRENGRKTPEQLAVFGGMENFCMLKVTLDAFEQAGMIEYVNGAPKVVPVQGKRDLLQSGIIANLKQQFAVGRA